MPVFLEGPIYILSFLLIISVVIVVHELGHYWAGRRYDAAAESFSLGFGQPIYERTDKRGTRWRLNWIPLGGFVKFVGEAQTAGDIGKVEQGLEGRAFPELSVGARSVIAVAGPAANFVFSTLVFGLLVLFFGVQQEAVFAQQIADNSAAEDAGIQPGDQFVRVNGKQIDDRNDVIVATSFSAGTPMTFELLRSGEPVSLEITPNRVVETDRYGVERSVGRIGVALTLETIDTTRVGPITAIAHGAGHTWQVVALTGKVLGRIITGKEPLSQMSGPVGMAKVTGATTVEIVEIENVSFGEKALALGVRFLELTALISVAVGFFNLLPIPVLDGGHLVFNAYEAVAGRPPSEQVQQACLTVGLVMLLGMFLFVTWNDVNSIGLLEVFNRL